MTFTGYGDAKRAASTYTNTSGPDLSGSAYNGKTDTYDLTKNIYDLAGNVFEWTLRAMWEYSYGRVCRGGAFINEDRSASFALYYGSPFGFGRDTGSRLALYIR